MAIPILLTVGALGVGWVALSKSRASMAPPSSGAAPTGSDPSGAGMDALQAAADAPGQTMIGGDGIAGAGGMQLVTDPSPTSPGAFVTGTSEENTSTGGSDPATQPSMVDGGEYMPNAPGNNMARLYTGPTSGGDGLATMNPSAIVYGNTKGLTRAQNAAAMAEIAPLAGLVY